MELASRRGPTVAGVAGLSRFEEMSPFTAQTRAAVNLAAELVFGVWLEFAKFALAAR